MTGLLQRCGQHVRYHKGLVRCPGARHVESRKHLLPCEGTGQEMVTGSWREEGTACKSGNLHGGTQSTHGNLPWKQLEDQPPSSSSSCLLAFPIM